ncbi:hypothetical protein NY547_09190 [Cnuibacter physcomitrellae]|uniref:hypothetical protein n=1 Tax=Cnuibacter physcomitrellae TaxID=1619308 RepID=UPI00217580E1|nr:hypothetical protein [Cnuibacter physcomitrellae]MCS5497409.1 hypothetical protein [Cnuibacter physcomitrellae]
MPALWVLGGCALVAVGVASILFRGRIERFNDSTYRRLYGKYSDEVSRNMRGMHAPIFQGAALIAFGIFVAVGGAIYSSL